MAKFFGKIGYVIHKETRPGIWDDTVIERDYYGDVLRNLRRLTSADKLNDDVSISNEISIVSDEFAVENIRNIRWVEWQGVKWKASVVEVSYPRIILSLGGLYNA